MCGGMHGYMSVTHHAEQKVSPEQLVLLIQNSLLLAMDHVEHCILSFSLNANPNLFRITVEKSFSEQALQIWRGN